jgi:ribosome-associated protein
VGPTAEPIEVAIREESIRLGQLLKQAGVVEDGTMARMVIEDGEVTSTARSGAARPPDPAPG